MGVVPGVIPAAAPDSTGEPAGRERLMRREVEPRAATPAAGRTAASAASTDRARRESAG